LYEFKDCNVGGSCFFNYPLSANISKQDDVILVSDGMCKVSLGLNSPEKDSVYEAKVAGDFLFWFKKGENGEMVNVGKIAGFDNTNYQFWLYDEGKDVSSCEYLIDQVTYSFTNRPTYLNNEFGFKAGILPGYKVEYLQDNMGMMMIRQVAGQELKDIIANEWKTWPGGTKSEPDPLPYSVEIGIVASENLLGFKDLGEYVKSECADCSTEFLENGVFVNVQRRQFSERVFLAISDNKKILYRAYLRLLSHRYKYHVKGYDEWVQTIEIF
jgi:hypothetical protein